MVCRLSWKKLYVEACLQNINKWLLPLVCDTSQLASPCLSICPCIIVEQLGLHCTDLQEIQHSHIFRKSLEKIQVLLKSDKNNIYLTWRPVYIYDSTLLHSSLEMFQRKFVYKIKTSILCLITFSPHFFFFFFKIVWKNMAELARTQVTYYGTWAVYAG